MEYFTELPEYPGYFVSTRGEVQNERGNDMARSYNQQGIATVYLVRDGVQVARSVAVLVAAAFVQCSEDLSDRQPSVIHLDGDRTNCSADNLLWRSRAVAIAYHKDLKQDLSRSWQDPIILIETEETFPTPLEAAMAYGIPESEVIRSVFNHGRIGTPPYGYRFTWLDEWFTY